MTVRLQVVIPFHQRLSASESDLEAACDRYTPLIEQLEANPGAKVTLHFTGHLLDHLSRKRSELLWRIKALLQAESAEILGGLFYGAPPALLRDLDVRGQVEMMAEYWESAAGAPPRGFWLPQFAWSPELPRLLEDSSLEYGFVSASQVIATGALPALGCIERGGRKLGAFVLDPELSALVPATPVDAWVEAVVAATRQSGSELISVYARAETLAEADSAWLAAWLGALGGSRADLESVLPSHSLVNDRPAGRLRLLHGIPAELGARGTRDGAVDWTDFPAEFPEVDALYRKMLHASDKLSETIETMEESSLEDEWSDTLATAQRLVFAAQTADGFWRGSEPGFSDPAMRDAVFGRLSQAEAMIDRLVQGEDDWIGAEEEDRDADLTDEVFVANRHLIAWLVPAQGGAVRALEDRSAARNLLDGAGRSGIREWLLPADAQAASLFTGKPAQNEVPQIVRNEIDEEGDGTYHLVMRRHLKSAGREAVVEKEITVPIDAGVLNLSYRVEPAANGLVAVELPFRLGSGPVKLSVNGQPADSAAGEHSAVTSLRLEDSGVVVEVSLTPALDIWVWPLRDRNLEQGLSIAALIPPASVSEATLVIKLQA